MSIPRRSALDLRYAPARMRFGVFPAAFVLFVSANAWAEGVASSTPTGDRSVTDISAAPEQAAAHEHFEQALALYRAGKYHRAVEELDLALASDPSGKDLVYNLALVQEKLGDFGGAIASLQRFQGMEKDPAELERAAQTIERLQGARAELAAAGPRSESGAAPCPIRPARGRLDSWVIGTGGLAVASLLFGTVFGARALSLDPRGESTGPGTSFASLRDRANRAHTAAILADIAFSTSLLAGATAATLYFGRFADTPGSQAIFQPRSRMSAAWLELRY
jgi:tetratricopeptide (TPR) repeat protein